MKSKKHGGTRPGSGRPQKAGEPTVVTEESFNIWLCSRLEGAKRPAIEDYMVNLETAAAEYYASPNLFRYTQAVDNYVDNLLDTISRLKSEIDELKKNNHAIRQQNPRSANT